MRTSKFAVFRAALIACGLACALSFPALALAQQPTNRPATKTIARKTNATAQILKPQGFKLQPASRQTIQLRQAPAPELIKKSAAKVNSTAAEAPQSATRPKRKSKTLLPPAGATPKLNTAVARPAAALLQLPAVQLIPVTAEATDGQQTPAVSTAGGEPADDHSSIQQVAHQQPVRQAHHAGAVTPIQTAPRVYKMPPPRHVATAPRKLTAKPRVVPTVARPANQVRSREPHSLIRQVVDDASQPLQQPIEQPSGVRVLVPIESAPVPDDITFDGQDGLVTLVATGADLRAVLQMIAEHHGLNLAVGPDISGPVTVGLRGARMDEVLDAILGVAGYSWHRVGNLLYVTGAASAGMDPKVQGRTLQVYPLDYVAASDLESVATSLLSPVGTVHVITSSTEDQLRTREMLVVEDTLAAHRRIAEYIAQVDLPPRQVLIEAHVMQVALSEEERHGVNWRGLARWKGANITLEGAGFANDDPGGPSVALRVDGSDMDSFIELIRQNTNSRTLASPKVSVVNHQEAKIQIGQRLPYSVATTTQTSTIQNVQFLDVGIVLTVTPVITEDGNVLMTVMPKVSGGKITESGFPEEDTTEVQTTVLMPDGGGIVIGGLIREDDAQAKAIVPGIGRVPLVGRLFRRRSAESRRNELVVALVTHVLPDVYGQRSHEQRELDQTLPNHSKIDLLHPPLPIRGCYHH